MLYFSRRKLILVVFPVEIFVVGDRKLNSDVWDTCRSNRALAV